MSSPYTDVAWPAVLGFVLGYVLLHPISMVIFRLLDPHAATPNPGIAGWEQFLHSFTRSMTTMGFAFGWLGAAMAAAFAWHRKRIANQRDQLARRLEDSDHYRAELEKQTELLRTKLRQMASLEVANRHNTQFIVHDFKTNLACVIGFAELLLEKSEWQPDSETRTALEGILRQSSRMLSAVNDLLEFARANIARILAPSGMLSAVDDLLVSARFKEIVHLRKEETLVRELLSEAIGDFSLPGLGERIKLDSKHLNCQTLCCDRRLLIRVLTNLISNALRHNPPDTHVVVDAEIDPENSNVIFSCRDNGNGISSDRIAHIFRKSGGALAETKESRNLGLAFCTSAVEAHGGRIWCESIVGKGSSFYFSIPLERSVEKWMAQTKVQEF